MILLYTHITHVKQIESELNTFITLVQYAIPLLVATLSIAFFGYWRLQKVWQQARDNHAQLSTAVIPKLDALQAKADATSQQVGVIAKNGNGNTDTATTQA